MTGLLKERYKVKVANNGERALKSVQGDAAGPDPARHHDAGHGRLRGAAGELKADPSTRDIPVIFLTAKSAGRGRDRTASRWARSTTSPSRSPRRSCWRACKTQLQLKAAADFLRDQNAYLEAEVAQAHARGPAIQDVTIMAMASLAETRDNETGNHIRRTQNYVRALAEKLQDASALRLLC